MYLTFYVKYAVQKKKKHLTFSWICCNFTAVINH